jgi:hypothetical protein
VSQLPRLHRPNLPPSAEATLEAMARIVGVDLNTLAPEARWQCLAEIRSDPRSVASFLQGLVDEREHAAGRDPRRHDGQAGFRKARRKHGPDRLAERRHWNLLLAIHRH